MVIFHNYMSYKCYHAKIFKAIWNICVYLLLNHIQHYRESPLVQKAISDIGVLLKERQESRKAEERPNIRQSVREALKNRKKAQEQTNQEQAKPKKANSGTVCNDGTKQEVIRWREFSTLSTAFDF